PTLPEVAGDDGARGRHPKRGFPNRPLSLGRRCIHSCPSNPPAGPLPGPPARSPSWDEARKPIKPKLSRENFSDGHSQGQTLREGVT
ncbi:hypothetical protein PAHAL_3G087600, partial [Panicum hallii]